MYRGYTLLKANKKTPIRHIEVTTWFVKCNVPQVSKRHLNKWICVVIQRFSGEKRPIWFVFTGMGCHWPSMGASLLKIPVCAAAIQKCHRLLEPKGVNLIDIITNQDPKIFDDTLNSFIGIGVIQVMSWWNEEFSRIRVIGNIYDLLIDCTCGLAFFNWNLAWRHVGILIRGTGLCLRWRMSYHRANNIIRILSWNYILRNRIDPRHNGVTW